MRALVILMKHLPAIIGCVKLLLSYMQFRMSICKLLLNRHNSLCIGKFFLKYLITSTTSMAFNFKYSNFSNVLR